MFMVSFRIQQFGWYTTGEKSCHQLSYSMFRLALKLFFDVCMSQAPAISKHTNRGMFIGGTEFRPAFLSWKAADEMMQNTCWLEHQQTWHILYQSFGCLPIMHQVTIEQQATLISRNRCWVFAWSWSLDMRTCELCVIIRVGDQHDFWCSV